MHEDARGAWEVLGDWLQQRDDVRGELVALALAVEEGRAPPARRRAEMTRLEHVLLSPLAEAHPLGVRAERAAQRSFRRGMLWELSLPEALEPALPALLQTGATGLLHALSLKVTSAQAPLLEVLMAHAQQLAHLQTVQVRVLGMTRQVRQRAAERLRASLPQLAPRGMEYRKVGSC